MLRELRTIDRAELTPRERISYDLFERLTAESIEGQAFPEELLQVDNLRSVAELVPRTICLMPADTPEERDRLEARKDAVPRLVDQTIALLELGIERGVTQSQAALTRVPGQLERQLDSSDSGGIWRERVLPSFEKLRRYLVERYIPSARPSTDWASLPRGEAWYEYKVRVATTTRQTPRELHEVGLQEVARLRSQMSLLAREAGFADDFPAFRDFMRTDDRFFFDDADALLAAYRDVCKRIEPGLVKLFGRLPWLPYGVAPVPDHLQKAGPVAYYQSGSVAGRRAGWFHANTYDVRTRPKWEMDVLTLHEAVPGHHLQIALALEMDDLPDFRKWSFLDAYVEGWALYAESLGDELGLYKDPYSRMGRLSYDALRSCRLVIDTGLHAFGWSRERSIDYLLSNSCEAPHDVAVEIDRYIGMPAQALSYKAGELVIRRLRDELSKKHGDRFDLRAFHDSVLAEGPLPLDMLEAQVLGNL